MEAAFCLEDIAPGLASSRFGWLPSDSTHPRRFWTGGEHREGSVGVQIADYALREPHEGLAVASHSACGGWPVPAEVVHLPCSAANSRPSSVGVDLRQDVRLWERLHLRPVALPG
jgi:hypothetical protein